MHIVERQEFKTICRYRTGYGLQHCLRGGGGGETFIRPFFCSISYLLLTHTKQEDKRKMKCPKSFWPGLYVSKYLSIGASLTERFVLAKGLNSVRSYFSSQNDDSNLLHSCIA